MNFVMKLKYVILFSLFFIFSLSMEGVKSMSLGDKKSVNFKINKFLINFRAKD